MILTVFIIAVALGTVTELQMIPVFFCPAAYRAFVNRSVLWLHLFHIALKLIAAAHFLWPVPLQVSAHNEKDQEVQKRHQD